MSATVDKESLRQKVKALKSVPTLPGVFDKVSELVADPDASAEDIGNVISSDQALSAKILKVVNSALHGFPGRISSVTHALIILGFEVVQGLVLSTSVFDMMIGKGMHMNSLLVFIGIIGGIKLFGILGIIYGPLIITIFLTLAEIYRVEYKEELG